MIDLKQKTFLDTNILVYSYQENETLKYEIANSLIKKLWENGGAVLSTQVLQEFCVTLHKKVKPAFSLKQINEIIADYQVWEIYTIQPNDIFEALKIQSKYQFSFWDSLIVQAALQADCSQIITEDLQHGQKIKSLKIVNPFL